MIMSTNTRPISEFRAPSIENKADTASGMTLLHPDFAPTARCVICARGKQIYEHEGNQRFRALVKQHLPTYSSCVTKMQKTRLVSHIIETVRKGSPNGGFVKFVKGRWYEVGDRRAKEKTGQTMRDLLHTRYSSSTKAKARARRQLREDRDVDLQDLPGLPARSASSSDDFLRQRARLSSRQRLGEGLDMYADSINSEFQFSMAAHAFGSECPADMFDTDPLPLDDALVDLDFEAQSSQRVSEDSFKAAMDILYRSL